MRVNPVFENFYIDACLTKYNCGIFTANICRTILNPRSDRETNRKQVRAMSYDFWTMRRNLSENNRNFLFSSEYLELQKQWIGKESEARTEIAKSLKLNRQFIEELERFKNLSSNSNYPKPVGMRSKEFSRSESTIWRSTAFCISSMENFWNSTARFTSAI